MVISLSACGATAESDSNADIDAQENITAQQEVETEAPSETIPETETIAEETIQETETLAETEIKEEEQSETIPDAQMEENPKQESPAQRATADAVMQYFIDHNAPNLGEYLVYDEATDANGLLGRPGQYTSKVGFGITTVEKDDPDDPFCATVEVFDNAEDANKRYEYINGIYESFPTLAEYLYLNDYVVLRMQFDVLPSDEKVYEQLIDEYMNSLQ